MVNGLMASGWTSVMGNYTVVSRGKLHRLFPIFWLFHGVDCLLSLSPFFLTYNHFPQPLYSLTLESAWGAWNSQNTTTYGKILWIFNPWISIVWFSLTDTILTKISSKIVSSIQESSHVEEKLNESRGFHVNSFKWLMEINPEIRIYVKFWCSFS